MKRRFGPCSFVLLALALTACKKSIPLPFPFCPAIMTPAVRVLLTDRVDGAPVRGATLTLTDGEFRETMREVGEGHYAGGYQRPGTYAVTVVAEGYAPASAEGIEAPGTGCGPDEQRLQIALERSAAGRLYLMWTIDADGEARAEILRAVDGPSPGSSVASDP